MPDLLADGRVCVDMGEPVLTGAKVPTTLVATDGDRVIKADLQVAGRTWTVTAVSFGNPHAVVYSVDGQLVNVRFSSIDAAAQCCRY